MKLKNWFWEILEKSVRDATSMFLLVWKEAFTNYGISIQDSEKSWSIKL